MKKRYLQHRKELRKWRKQRRKERMERRRALRAWWKRPRPVSRTLLLFVLALLTRTDDPRDRLLRAYLEPELEAIERRLPLRLLRRRRAA